MTMPATAVPGGVVATDGFRVRRPTGDRAMNLFRRAWRYIADRPLA